MYPDMDPQQRRRAGTPGSEAVSHQSESLLFGIARHDTGADQIVQSLSITGGQGRSAVECVMARADVEMLTSGVPALDLLSAYRRIEEQAHRCFMAKFSRAQFVETAFPRLQLQASSQEIAPLAALSNVIALESRPQPSAELPIDEMPWRKALPANWRYLRAG